MTAHKEILIQAIGVAIICGLMMLIVSLGGCASKKIMKNCEHQNEKFWSCEEP